MFFFIFLYLLFFLINGDRGIISYYKIKNEQLNLEKKLSLLEEKNNFFIDRITRLQVNTLDLDYLDEQIRNETGFINNNEILINFYK